jgi:3-oxoacyl-[acyl-carrier protein] reductase
MKYALVTGSTKGIGKAIGLKLLRNGYFVIFNYCKSEVAVKKLTDEIESEFKDRFSILQHDLSDLRTVNLFIEKVLSISMKIDVVVFNTGLTDRSAFGDITINSWNKVFDANLNVPFFILQALRSNIINNGSIIFIGSMLGNLPHSVSIAYGVSKAAVHSLVQNLVKFLSIDGVRVNGIAPGFVDTEWQAEKPHELREKIKGKVALKRFALTSEVADLCYSVVENQYINGQILQIDGGYSYR